jgi:hypothetical protein
MGVPFVEQTPTLNPYSNGAPQVFNSSLISESHLSKIAFLEKRAW